LSVSDGQVTEFKPFEVDVISAGEAVGELIRFIQNLHPRSGIKPNIWKQLIDTLHVAEWEFAQGDWNAGLIHLRIFEFRVSTQIGPVDPDLANSLTYIAQQIASAVQGSTKHQPLIGTLAARSSNNKSLMFNGIPGQIYLVQASGDLVHWETIGIASETSIGNYRFNDTGSANAPARYYRLVVP
jgi:hypothetical protein